MSTVIQSSNAGPPASETDQANRLFTYSERHGDLPGPARVCANGPDIAFGKSSTWITRSGNARAVAFFVDHICSSRIPAKVCERIVSPIAVGVAGFSAHWGGANECLQDQPMNLAGSARLPAITLEAHVKVAAHGVGASREVAAGGVAAATSSLYHAADGPDTPGVGHLVESIEAHHRSPRFHSCDCTLQLGVA